MEEEKKRNNGAGVAIGLIIWGVCFLGAPGFAGLSGWPMWALWITGFVLLLTGSMGVCVEVIGGLHGRSN